MVYKEENVRKGHLNQIGNAYGIKAIKFTDGRVQRHVQIMF